MKKQLLFLIPLLFFVYPLLSQKVEVLKYEELKKPDANIDHGFLDNIDRELCLIVKTATSLQGTKA